MTIISYIWTILIDILGFKLGRNHINAAIVTRLFLIGLPTKHIRIHTVVLNKLMTMRTHIEEKPH